MPMVSESEVPTLQGSALRQALNLNALEAGAGRQGFL